MSTFHATSSNRYAGRKVVSVPAGELSQAIYLNVLNPYKLDCLSGNFSSPASGNLTVKVIRCGNETTVFTNDLSGASTFLLSDIGAWLSSNAQNGLKTMSASNPKTDIVVIDNKTDQDLVSIVDFTY